jgi:hypothetical protein
MTAEQVWFRSGGKVYELAEMDQVSLRDIVTFPREAAQVLGEPMTWSQFQDHLNEMEALDEEERAAHPLSDFVMTVLIWISRRAAGETVTYGECLDAPFEWVEMKVPQDRQPGKAKGAKKAPAKKSTRTSARAAAGPAGG